MLSQKLLLSAAGGAAADRIYVDDVFSIDLWEGNGTSQTINNGIDLSGEGGMVWTKSRTESNSHLVFDTERGASKRIFTNSSAAQFTDTSYLTSFNSNGYSVGDGNGINNSSADVCGWTFRKCPGFFDVVTYTGTGSVQNISHSLGSAPGSIWIKSLSSGAWTVTHRSTGWNYYLELNENLAAQQDSQFSSIHNSTAPTASVFTLGNSGAVNASGTSYVAFIFAHDDQSFGDDGDEAIIKCDTYTGNGDQGDNDINVGFEPQWLLIKRTNAAKDWMLFDNMRGIVTGGNDAILEANNTNNEGNFIFDFVKLNPTGFSLVANNGDVNGNNDPYIYIAIRRPHKPPEAGTDVFAIDNKSAASTNTPQYTSNFPVDFLLNRFNVHSTGGPSFRNRHANEYIQTNEATARVADSSNMTKFNYNNGYGDLTSSDSNDYVYMFRRAPGFADLVFYDGDGNTSRSINHNLGVAPELVIIKNRFNTSSGSSYWTVHSTQITASQYLRLDENQAVGAAGVDSYPTATTFPVSKSTSVYNTLNKSGDSYVAYLFASVSGICKIGKYTGAGGSTDVDVDCGFTNGARFVIIKKTNGIGDWNVFDTSRGINSGTEKYFTLNNSFAPYDFDVIDPLSSGFTVVNETAASQGFNVSGDTYLFIAIA